MFKKILSLVLVCGLLFSFSACDNTKAPTDENKEDTSKKDSIVFAGDYTELSSTKSEPTDKNNNPQSSSEESSEPKQEASKQQQHVVSSETITSSEPVSSEVKNEEKETSKNQTASQGSNSNNIISRDKAKNIALNHAGVSEKDIFDFDIELDKDKKALHYDIDFEVSNTDYEYEIDATSGKILFSKAEKDDNYKAPSSSKTQKVEAKISKHEAENLVFNHLRIKKSDVRDYEIDFDDDDKNKVYEIDFKYGGYEYSYEVNAETGKVVLKEKERD